MGRDGRAGRDDPGEGGGDDADGSGPSGGGDPTGRLFTYGTLRAGAGTPEPVAGLLREAAERLGRGRIDARLFDAGGFPAALPAAKGRVVGDLFRLRRPGGVLAALDRYEGCDGDRSLFRREVLPVRRPDGGIVSAWVYVWNRPVEGLPEIPSGDWLAATGGEGDAGRGAGG